MTFKEIITDIKGICKAFNLGQYKGCSTKKHTVAGYEVANFETSTGNYEYIYKS